MPVNKLGIVCIVLGILVGVGVEVGGYFLKDTINKKVNNALVMDGEKDKDYEDWTKGDTADDATPQFRKFWFFNITNPNEVLAGQVPKVVEIGPYSFRKYSRKLDPSFNSDNTEVTYTPYTYHVFDEGSSAAGLAVTDKITMPNPTYFGTLANPALGGKETNLLSAAIPSAVALINDAVTNQFVLGVKIKGGGAVLNGIRQLVMQALAASSIGPEAASYAQWANMSEIKSGISTSFANIQGYELDQTSTAAPITQELAKALWNTANPLSFATTSGLPAWFASPPTQVISTFGISSGQYARIAAWLVSVMSKATFQAIFLPGFKQSLAPAGLDTTGVNTLEDIGLLQWATGRVITGVSVTTFAPAGTPAPEWALYCQNAAGQPCNGIPMTTASARAILMGSTALSNQANLIEFSVRLAGCPTNCPPTTIPWLVSTFNISSSNPAVILGFANALGGYLKTYLPTNFIVPKFQALTSVAGAGGQIASRTITEWLFFNKDPLVSTLQPTNPDIWNQALIGNATSEDQVRRDEKASTYYTGKGDLSKRLVYKLYEGESYVGELTNRSWSIKVPIEGTDATSFSPRLKKGAPLRAWVNFIYRAAALKFSKEDKLKGVKIFSYSIDPVVFEKSADFDQEVVGLFNMTRIVGAPLFVTQPHYLSVETGSPLGDLVKKYSLSPDATKHDFVVDVEPTTGVVINGRKRIQFSMMTHPTEVFYPAIGTNLVPMFWVEEGGTLSDDDAKTLKTVQLGLWVSSTIMFIVGFAAGGFFLLLGVLLVVFKRGSAAAPRNRFGMEKMTEL